MSTLRDMLAPALYRIPLPRRQGRGSILAAVSRLIPGAHRTIGVSVATHRYLLYVVFPVWLAAGFADYLFHRRTKIELTSGPRESLIHNLMMAETGIPVLMGMFFEVNALVLLIMASFFVAHEATAYWDVNYAETRRTVPPNEQHAHSFLEVNPFMALSMVVCLNWEQALALLGIGPERPELRLRPRRPPASRRYVLGILSAVGLLNALPYAEEFLRCYLTTPTLEPTPPVASEPVGNLDVDNLDVERGAQAWQI
jgi:hypothetical protein